jgi:phage/plasmid-like protein (TIGR03299 family)
MSHMIDETTGQPAIAYVGKTPWHGLGTELRAGCSVEQWTEAAGLDYVVERSPVQFVRKPTPAEIEEFGSDTLMDPTVSFKGRDVLYRTDTGAPLWVASKSYNIVQPSEVMDFFAKLSEIGGFELETAGALSDGKRIWGLARVNDGAPVVGQDVVRPYVLLATSYDGTLATTAKFTAVRVVCHNTLTMSVGSSEDGMRLASSETDTVGKAVSSLVRIPHSTTFDADAVRKSLGIVKDVFERWLVESALLAEKQIDDTQFGLFLENLLQPLQPKTVHGSPAKPARECRPFARIKSIYENNLIGADLAGESNRWRALNAVTQFVDYERGRTANSRLDGAWFGVGDAIKTRAFDLLVKTPEFEVVS